MREGRYVIPVRADARATVGGIVHDTSASGLTVFVEPIETVELNNTWRQLQRDEEHEIERILRRLSDGVADAAAALDRSVDGLAQFDFQLAKARFSSELDAASPHIWEEEAGRRRGQARGVAPGAASAPHRAEASRADRHRARRRLSRADHYRAEHGGKTVALKTVGLLTLMAQAGLHIPAEPDSVVSGLRATSSPTSATSRASSRACHVLVAPDQHRRHSRAGHAGEPGAAGRAGRGHGSDRRARRWRARSSRPAGARRR